MQAGSGIDFSHHRCHRTTASNGHAQIVHRVFVRSALEGFQLLQNALHPMEQTPMVRDRPGTGSKHSHSCLVGPFGTASGIAAPTEWRQIAYPSVLAPSRWGCGKVEIADFVSWDAGRIMSASRGVCTRRQRKGETKGGHYKGPKER